MKKIQVSGRIEEAKFNSFKDEYLKQLKGSFSKDTDPVILDGILEVSNTELIERALTFATLYLGENEVKKNGTL